MVVDAEMDGKVAASGSLVNAAAQAPRMTDASRSAKPRPEAASVAAPYKSPTPGTHHHSRQYLAAPAHHHGRPDQVLRALPPKQVLHVRHGECQNARLTKDSLGGALTDTLDYLITERRIEPQLAMKILINFDKAVADGLAEKVKSRLSFKGHLDTYRFCDDVWTFIIKDINFKLDNSNTVHADRVKIVSCNTKRPGEV
jgi:transcription initiation factor TFIIA small subunit